MMKKIGERLQTPLLLVEGVLCIAAGLLRFLPEVAAGGDLGFYLHHCAWFFCGAWYLVAFVFSCKGRRVSDAACLVAAVALCMVPESDLFLRGVPENSWQGLVGYGAILLATVHFLLCCDARRIRNIQSLYALVAPVAYVLTLAVILALEFSTTTIVSDATGSAIVIGCTFLFLSHIFSALVETWVLILLNRGIRRMRRKT